MRDRARDCALLSIVAALVSLPNLGVPSLWDLDEGVNAETAREMRDSETWVIPTYNYQLRTAKPVMLYWFQRITYDAFGVNEWSARLPSALAGWLSILLVYELGRRCFGRETGLLAGLILASVAQFAVVVHAATPDATLLAFTILTYLAFWIGHTNGGKKWWVWTASACALAFLTKGPIGLILPEMAIVAYFAWNRELYRLFDRRIAAATFAFLLIAGPWYGLVASETRGEWLRTFFTKENLARFHTVMDRHEGSVAYYPAMILIMFAPWSAFLLPQMWFGIRGAKRTWLPVRASSERSINRMELEASEDTALANNSSFEAEQMPSARGIGPVPKRIELTEAIRAHRFLLSWIAVYIAFFTVAATKLPNYMLPIYPAMAVLTARFLIGWRDRIFSVPQWMMVATVGGMATNGIVCIIGVLLAARFFPALGDWTALGVIPLAAAICMAFCLRRGSSNGFIAVAAAASIAFIGLTAAFPLTLIEPQKASKELVRITGLADHNRDLRLGCFEWLLPSVVYYSGREVKALPSAEKVVEFLEVPTPAYLFIAETTWNRAIAGKVTVPHRIAASHYDFLEKGNIIVVTNDFSGELAANGK